jgi:hypothetical protein
MWHLIKKFSFFFVVFFIIMIGAVFPAFNYDRITSPNPLSLTFVLYLTSYLLMVVIAAIWTHEQMESKAKGYEFLRSLPIDAKDIVTAKFAVVLLSLCLITIFHCVAFYLISSNPEYFNPACSVIIISADICLIISALLYLGIFRFGYVKFGKYIILTWILIIFSPIPIYQFLLPRLGISRLDIIEKMASLSWPLVTAVSLIVYLGLMWLSINALKRAKGYGG